MANEISFESVLPKAICLPLVRIERDPFLRKELAAYCDEQTVQKAVEECPAAAGISKEVVNKIAKACITYETRKVSALSFAAGIPGGLAMLGTVPADLVQYMGHVLRVLQKLAYLYGWQDLLDDIKAGDEKMSDETSNILTLFVGVMFGVNGANTAIRKISEGAARYASKTLMQKALTKGTIYPIVKKIASMISVQMTKEIFSKGVSKIIPVVGGVVSGSLTYATFRPMSERLRVHLATLKWANVDYYKEAEAPNSSPDSMVNIEVKDVVEVESVLDTE